MAPGPFSPAAVHQLRHADDFWPDALALRDELLTFADWGPMSQDGWNQRGVVDYRAQNGITTGMLGDASAERLPRCAAFRDFMIEQREALCGAVGIPFAPAMQVEMNAMAYGNGAWLSPHTDHSALAAAPRQIAWMLYLTDPADGEWDASRGGAVRVFEPRGAEARLRPKFNRFALFRVSPASFHEIERVTWDAGWTGCRLALSGWIRGAEAPQARGTRLYARRSSAAEERQAAEALYAGALAASRLLRAQRLHGGLDTADVDARIAFSEQQLDGHRSAPPGTVFVDFLPGPAGAMIVKDDQDAVVYFGPAVTAIDDN